MSRPLFADAEFWSVPSVTDVVGLVLTVASIWYAWWLAKRQLRADLRKAAAEAVERVSNLLLANELAEAVQFLHEAGTALSDRAWDRALLRLQDATAWLARLAESGGIDDVERKHLVRSLVELQGLAASVRAHARSNERKAHMAVEKVGIITQQAVALQRIRGRLTASTLSPADARAGNGRQTGPGDPSAAGANQGGPS